MNRGTTHAGTLPSLTLASVARQLYCGARSCSPFFGGGGPGMTLHMGRGKFIREAPDATNAELAGN